MINIITKRIIFNKITNHIIKIFSNSHQTQPNILLSQKNLSLCSSLMRSILSSSPHNILETQQNLTQKDQIIYKDGKTSNHDLQNFRPMLAGSLITEADLDKFCLKKKSPLIIDIKYDGQRTLISYKRGQRLQMISRNEKTQQDFYQNLLTEIQSQLSKTDIQSIKLDGQIVAVNKSNLQPLPFGQLLKQKRYKNAKDVKDEESNVILLVYIFDVLEFNGKNLLQTPLIQRRKLIPNLDIFRNVQFRIIHFPEERSKIFEFFRQALVRKYEGLIIKGSQDLYFTTQSRTHWKKLKRGFSNTRDSNISKVELDLIVMGANYGQGSKNSKLLTSYLVGAIYNNKIIPISNVGSGLTEQMISLIVKHIQQNQIITKDIPEQYELGGAKADVYFKPKLVFQIHAQQLTLSPLYKLGAGVYGGISLRFPVFKGIRSDKRVQDANKGEQIIQLSKSFNFNLPS